MCRGLLPEATDLARDRIWHEWEKWAARGTHPSLGLEFLRETNWLSLYPELEALVGVQQDPEWHPEGDVWTHTLHVCDAAAVVADREQLAGRDRIVVYWLPFATIWERQHIPGSRMADGMHTDTRPEA